MEQNNFEKNIQQSMDGFKIPPSDAVWNHVEKKIQKKKKDKKIIFIFFFLVLFLLSGGYWIFNSTKNNSQPQNHQLINVLKNDSKPTNNTDSSSTHTIIPSGNIPGNTESSIVSEEKTKTQSIVIQNKKAESVIRKNKENISVKPGFREKERIVSYAQNEKGINRKIIGIEKEDNTVDPNNLTEKNTMPGNLKEKNANPDSTIITENKINADSILKNKEEKLIAKEDSSGKKISSKLKKDKWSFGITFSGGSSTIGDGPFGINNAVNCYTLNSSFPGSITNPVYSPSKIKGSAAFIGGAFIEKNISARNKISLGISYKYYSLINEVGKRIDSAIFYSSQNLSSSGDLYSVTNNGKAYRNNFHYLEIPVSIKFQFGKSKKLPVYWDIGINISQLISSNALQFASNPGLYYHDNSLFNKTQIGLQTGFSATLFPNTKNPLSIGPYFIYSTSKLANEGLYDGKHFSFIGMRAEILFRKK
ncbi:MAG: outer membrane beta-barrel protein [Ginsengibacter sp.]